MHSIHVQVLYGRVSSRYQESHGCQEKLVYMWTREAETITSMLRCCFSPLNGDLHLENQEMRSSKSISDWVAALGC